MEHHDLFCFLFGSALVALSICSKNHFPPRSRVVFLSKGLGIITLGLAILFEGPVLFVALLIEAIVLMAIYLKLSNRIVQAAAWLAAALSFFVLPTLNLPSVPPWTWLMATFAWMIFGSMHRWSERGKNSKPINPGGLVASLLSLVFLFAGYLQHQTNSVNALILGSLGIVALVLGLNQRARKHAFDLIITYALAGFIGLVTLLETAGSPLNHGLAGAFLGSVVVYLAWRPLEDGEHREGLHLFSAAFLALNLGLFVINLELRDTATFTMMLIIIGLPIVAR